MTEQKPTPSLLDRLAAAKAAVEAEAAAQDAQMLAQSESIFALASARLKELMKLELGLDVLPPIIRFHKDYSHGSPAADYALVQINQFWLGVEIVNSEVAILEAPLVGIVHCENGHVMDREFPHGADDTWDRALYRLDDTQRQHGSTLDCSVCNEARQQASQYRPPKTTLHLPYHSE